MATPELKIINGNRDEFVEEIGRKIMKAIARRDDAEYDRLRRILHPQVNLTVVAADSDQNA